MDNVMRTLRNAEDPLKALGSGSTEYAAKYDRNLLETFLNPWPQNNYTIEIVSPEFTCLCPKTGQPDFATIHVIYSPDIVCMESKSFKLYLFSFRQEGAFHEMVTGMIAHDLFELMEPKWIEVTGKFQARGGITFHPKFRLEK